MRLIIEIPDEIRKGIYDGVYCGISDKRVYDAIKNGTPLPEEPDKETTKRPTGERSGLADIRWTDKVSIDADGNIRDFDGTILYSMRNEYGEEKKND